MVAETEAVATEAATVVAMMAAVMAAAVRGAATMLTAVAESGGIVVAARRGMLWHELHKREPNDRACVST